jgi:hypothetical protein
VFPIIITTVIAFFDWRIAAVVSGVALLLYLIRLKFTNLLDFDKQLSVEGKPSTLSLLKDYKEVVSDKRFGIMMPASFILSFTNTANLFYQYVFVEDKGWSPQLFAIFLLFMQFQDLCFPYLEEPGWINSVPGKCSEFILFQ